MFTLKGVCTVFNGKNTGFRLLMIAICLDVVQKNGESNAWGPMACF